MPADAGRGSDSRVLRGAAGAAASRAQLGSELRRTPGSGAGRGDVDRWLDHAASAVTASEREAARSEGYAAGYAEGRRAAAEELQAAQARREAELAELDRRLAAEYGRALTAVDRAAGALEHRAAVAAAHQEQALAETAFALAVTLLGRELELATQPGLDAVRRALALAPHDRPVTVRLNPADAATLAELPGWAGGREIRVVPDPSVAVGDCLADCDATSIDARLGPALERVKEVLFG